MVGCLPVPAAAVSSDRPQAKHAGYDEAALADAVSSGSESYQAFLEILPGAKLEVRWWTRLMEMLLSASFTKKNINPCCSTPGSGAATGAEC